MPKLCSVVFHWCCCVVVFPWADDDYLSGVLRVRVMTATDLKARTGRK